jgi:hypothetical protein
MLPQCANPACRTPLRYLRDGRLFQFEVRPVDFERPGQPRRMGPAHRQVAHFWLCGNCSLDMTLAFDKEKGVTVTPLQPGLDTDLGSVSAGS